MTDSPRPPLNWRRQLYHSITTFDTSEGDVSSGLRVAVLTTLPLIVGLATNQTGIGLTAALGAFNVSMPEVPRHSKLSQLHVLGLACVVNAFAIAAGTLVGMTGLLAIPLFGIGFFVAAFLAIYSDVAIIGSVACVLFSIGVGLPGGGTVLAAWDRLWSCFLGGLLGFAGLAVHGIISSAMNGGAEPKEEDGTSPEESPSRKKAQNRILLKGFRETFKPITANLSLKSQHLRFSLVFGVVGALGLAIALGLDLTRDYWVMLTLAILLLRADISTTVSFTVMRIIGTIIGALVGFVVIDAVTSSVALLPFLFTLCALYIALRGLNYGLGTIFLTPFVLVLISIPSPGHPLLAEVRVLDSLVAAGLALAAVSFLWASTHWGEGRE